MYMLFIQAFKDSAKEFYFLEFLVYRLLKYMCKSTA